MFRFLPCVFIFVLSMNVENFGKLLFYLVLTPHFYLYYVNEYKAARYDDSEEEFDRAIEMKD